VHDARSAQTRENQHVGPPGWANTYLLRRGASTVSSGSRVAGCGPAARPTMVRRQVPGRGVACL